MISTFLPVLHSRSDFVPEADGRPTFLQLPNPVLGAAAQRPHLPRLSDSFVARALARPIPRLRKPEESLVFTEGPGKRQVEKLGQFQHACQHWPKSVLGHGGIFRKKAGN